MGGSAETGGVEADDTIEFVEYQPTTVECGDGGVVLGDITEFLIDTDAVAILVRDGHLFVLRRETLKWMNVEEVRKTEKKGAVSVIRGKQSS
jgi:hypothetical protein